MVKAVKFNDLRAQYLRQRKEIDRAVLEVLDSGTYILGSKVREFESAFAKLCRTKYCVGLGSGTEAIYLGLMALGICKGDEVITVSNTVVATVVPIVQLGAVPVFVDISPDSFTIDAEKIEARITNRTKAIIPVHLYGHPANMHAIKKISKKHRLKVIEDACQALGSVYKGRLCGSIGDLGCFSFYPTKNLGGYGDGGAIVTNSKALYDRIVALRVYGTKDGINYNMVGFNSRLDELQAAVLSVKARHLDEFNEERRSIASIYNECIKARDVILPVEADGERHNRHLYVIKAKRRDELRAYLKEKGIDTLIHYQKPVHLQKAYGFLGYKKYSLPVTERVCRQILSLPIYPGMPKNHARYVADEINKFYS